MPDNIDKIISDMLLVNKDNLNRENIKLAIHNLKLAFDKNKRTLDEAGNVDIKNNNGFRIDCTIIDKIFDNVLKDAMYYGDVTLSTKNDEIIYGRELVDIGNVLVINDGNPYVIIEMIMRNIMSGNTTIFVNDGYMFGVNQVIIKIVKQVLEISNLSANLVNIYVTDNYDTVLNNYANIDLVVCIGDHNLQNLILNKSKNNVIVSGYDNYDMYIEDDTHIEFINKIMNTGLKINLYVNKNIKLDNLDFIEVTDLDEAIAMINYSGNRYSAGIFTASSENASKFAREVKSKIITVNTSPTIERISYIKQDDLMNEKVIIYPFGFKFDGSNIKVDIN